MAINADFTPTQTYDVSDLNQLVGCFIDGGVVGVDDLKVAYKNGRAIVGSGKCILPDKRVMTVEQGGYAINEEIHNGYIYIIDGRIEHSTDVDDEGIFLLAQITQGACTDLRKRAHIYTCEGVN